MFFYLSEVYLKRYYPMLIDKLDQFYKCKIGYSSDASEWDYRERDAFYEYASDICNDIDDWNYEYDDEYDADDEEDKDYNDDNVKYGVDDHNADYWSTSFAKWISDECAMYKCTQDFEHISL